MSEVVEVSFALFVPVDSRWFSVAEEPASKKYVIKIHLQPVTNVGNITSNAGWALLTSL